MWGASILNVVVVVKVSIVFIGCLFSVGAYNLDLIVTRPERYTKSTSDHSYC